MSENNNEPTISEQEVKMPEEQFGTTAEEANGEKPSHLGAVLGALIVILVLLLGGLYLWGTTLNKYEPIPTVTPTERPTPEQNNEPESTKAEAEVKTMQTVSTSDEISAIEADIDSTNLDELDAELNAIDAELDTVLQ